MIIGWTAMLVFALHSCTHMVAAGDTWVAMACGRHFLHHGVDTVEPFSANSHKAGPTPEEVKTWPKWAQAITNTVGLKTVRYWHPTGWVNQNWLTHVMFYWLTTTLGSEQQPYFDALVLWKFSLYILAAVCLYFTTRIYGVNRAVAVVFVCFSLFIGRSFFDVRPAGFSNLLVAVFSLVIALASYRNKLYIWLLVPLVVFWSNVHGGYIYAFLMLVPFVIWHAIMNLPKRWTVAAYNILLWLALYGMANRFLHHEYLKPVAVSHDWAFYLLLLTVAGSIALSRHKQVSDSGLVVFHMAVSCVLFLLFLTRFFPAIPIELGGREKDALLEYFGGARISYLGVFTFAMILGMVVAHLRDKIVHVMPPRAILHVIGAGAVAFVAMVVFNPFHLTNLTHTFEISVSKHAERWRDVHEWHRAFDWSNPVGTAVPFLVMYILAWLLLIAWVVLFVWIARRAEQSTRKRLKVPEELYAWPRVDLAMLIIAAMTVYMAIRSRRFIPIAAFAACPVLAWLVHQMIRGVAAIAVSRSSKRLEVPAMSAQVRSAVIYGGAMLVVFFALWWGFKFKYVYLDAWPADSRRTSVFMRMTASDAKPFEASKFICQNELRGKMFNYWTEGGFIAWGEEPDPNTGRTPLRLFMDGRAQAAYNVRAFDLWTQIMSGGPVVRRAVITNQDLTSKDYIEIGNWISEQLRREDVWVVLMPANQFDKPFVRGLEYRNQEWPIVFIDDKQKLFVDITTPQGRKLYEGVFTGQTGYPDEYSANMALGHNLLLLADPDQRRKGLELIIKAFEATNSPAAMIDLLVVAGRYPELVPRIDEVCVRYAQDFDKNKKTYLKQDGYNLRLEAGRLALLRLEQIARSRNDTRMASTYRQAYLQYERERDNLSDKKRW
ncbi:MAG: hypothetical protein JW955_09040 [Sedimentisphaerales bacterium]|nr:hypothetical protein [Sedimentisphaerales bacterium]